MTESHKSLFFVSLPKSGTVFTWNCLSGVTGLKLPEFQLLKGWKEYNAGHDFCCPELYACGDYNTQLLRPAEIKGYLRGYVFGSHMQASFHNMNVLEENGIDRISVLLRDPRDAFVSWVYHVNSLGPQARDFISKIYSIPRAYYNWTLERQFDYQIRTFLPIVVNWVEGWLDYYAAEDRNIAIQFLLYDELKRDPAGYIRRIAEYHGFVDIDMTKMIVPEAGKLHFRKGEHGQWKTEFSAVNQRLAAELLGDRVQLGFADAARRHAGFLAAEDCMQSGDYRDAAISALEVIIQFPNCQPCYRMLLDCAERLGVNTEMLRRMVERELATASIEDMFLYRDTLVKECKNLVRRLPEA